MFEKEPKGSMFFYSGNTNRKNNENWFQFSGIYQLQEKRKIEDVFCDIIKLKEDELKEQVVLTSMNKI